MTVGEIICLPEFLYFKCFHCILNDLSSILLVPLSTYLSVTRPLVVIYAHASNRGVDTLGFMNLVSLNISPCFITTTSCQRCFHSSPCPTHFVSNYLSSCLKSVFDHHHLDTSHFCSRMDHFKIVDLQCTSRS